MALLFTLSAGAILIILSVALFSLYSGDVFSQGQQQQGVQAYWNARSGLERYLDERKLPKTGVYALERGQCRVFTDKDDLVFEGSAGKQRRRLRLLQSDPTRVTEEPAS